ncbi:MAG: hypothetical protein HQL88_04580 [Magnetococcales bacterium]|nr:hypothetical protein [Magnetococcales bacterium]
MKKIVSVVCLLWFCWIAQPVSALAALEQLPLPPGSDQLGPIEQESAATKKESVPEKTGNATQQAQKESGAQAKAATADKKTELHKKASQGKQKKQTKKHKKKSSKKKKK